MTINNNEKSSLEKLCDQMPDEDDKLIYKPASKFKLYSSHKRFDNEHKYRQIYSAGILPFHVKNNTIYILLGKDKEGSWSDFGGRAEGQDSGRWDLTAVREFYEESIGSIMEIPQMLTLIQNKKYCIRLKGKTLNKSPYYMFFVKIPYKEYYRENFKSTLNFINYTKMFDKKYNEKTDIQWISLETLYSSVDYDNKCTINYPMREVFKDTFENNLSHIKKFGEKFFEEKILRPLNQ